MTYEELSEAIRSHGVSFGTGATSDEIAKAENTLSVTFPSGYRRLVGEFGWLGVGPDELFGLGAGVPSEVDVVRETLAERTTFHPLTPKHLVPIMNDGGGNLFCLDTTRGSGADCPVVFQDHELGEISDYSDSFFEWLFGRIVQRLR